MTIYIASDHRGFNLKNEIVDYLKQNSYEVTDLGANTLNPDDDYPEFAKKVAQNVVTSEKSLGILLCGSGVGVDVTVNKFDGIRASIGLNPEQIAAGRKDDNMNVLVLASDYTSIEDAKKIVQSFLSTEYEKNERHERRLNEISSFEKNN